MTQSEMLASICEQLTHLRTEEGYLNAGIPNYDHLFGRDACVSALQLLHHDRRIARATLKVLARYQGRHAVLRREEYPGKILHEHFPGGWRQMLTTLIYEGNRSRQLFSYLFWRFPYYGSVDAGAWYLILLHHYVRLTDDQDLLRELWPVAEGIVGWLDHHASHPRTGLVGFKRHYAFGLRSQSWKDTIRLEVEPPIAMIEVQGYYYYALNLLADLAEDTLRDAPQAEQLRGRAERLKTGFHDNFVLASGSYPLAVDGRGRAIRQSTSNPGHLLFTGILTRHQELALADRLMREDFLTPYGLRTQSSLEPGFDAMSYQNGSVWPFDTWVTAQGMAKIGRHKAAATLGSGLISVFDRWGNLPELYGVTEEGELQGIQSACRIQAWSAGALINLLEDSPVI